MFRRESDRSASRMSLVLQQARGSDDDMAVTAAERLRLPSRELGAELREFAEFGTRTIVGELAVAGHRVPTFTNEFWTSAQREGHSLHEISYRACFKPSLPAFFVERLSKPGDRVLDPFMGRGTTPLEAALRGRLPCGNAVNPLSALLVRPRLCPPPLAAVLARIEALDLAWHGELDEDLLAFFHPDTLRAIFGLREPLLAKAANGTLDVVDEWIRMVAVNRLTGHSAGFFSVYTLPPNQAVSPRAQAKINSRLKQEPPPRDVASIILAKSRALLRDVSADVRKRLHRVADRSQLVTGGSTDTPPIASNSIALAVTSPPFLDVVDYKTDNWLRCWFCGIDAAAVPVTLAKQVDAWQQFVTSTLLELRRVVRPGGHIAFEV